MIGFQINFIQKKIQQKCQNLTSLHLMPGFTCYRFYRVFIRSPIQSIFALESHFLSILSPILALFFFFDVSNKKRVSKPKSTKTKNVNKTYVLKTLQHSLLYYIVDRLSLLFLLESPPFICQRNKFFIFH